MKKIFLIFFVLFLSPTIIFAQEVDNSGRIIYTEFDPEYSIINTCISSGFDVWDCDSIDIDYDGRWDIRFHYGWASAEGAMPRFTTNFQSGYFESFYVCLRDSIYNSLDEYDDYMFVTTTVFGYEPFYACGESSSNVEFRLGFRKKVGENEWCYAWMRLKFVRLPNYGGFKYDVVDMAYCTIPNYPLKFGQKNLYDSLDENNILSNNYVLYPSPAKDKISLNLYNDIRCNELNIYSIDGRLLKTQNDHFENIDISNFSRGIYLVKIHLNDGNVFTDKIMKN